MKNYAWSAAVLVTLLSAGAQSARSSELTGIVLSQYQYSVLDPASPPTIVTLIFSSANYTFLAGTHYSNSFFNWAENDSYLPYGLYMATTEFEAPDATLLTPGTYLNATRFPFNLPGTPGMDYSFDSYGENHFQGQFTVLEAIYGQNNVMEHFGATFETFAADGRITETGESYFHYDVPEPASFGLAGVASLALVWIYRRRRRGAFLQ